MRIRPACFLPLVMVALLTRPASVQAQALRSPPAVVRSWNLTAAAASSNVTLGYSDVSSPVPKVSKSVMVCNDGVVTAIFNLNEATAVAPSAGGKNHYIFAGEKLSFDGEYEQVSLLRVTSDVTVRVIVSY